MAIIKLGYGTTPIDFEYDDGQFEVIGEHREEAPLSDAELGERFDNPIGSEQLERLIEPGQSVMIAVPDATREVGAGQVVNLLVRRLIANGTMSYEISIVLATGLHRKVTEKEKEEILTPFITQRVKVLDHDPTDLMGFVRLGETSGSIPVEINRNAVEADHLILVGGINFHYFAGFTGGRKLVCPGLASRKTVVGTHSLAFDSKTKSRAEGVGMGLLEDNPVHAAFIEAADFVNPTFAFSTFTNPAGDVSQLFCGNWIESHESACSNYLLSNTSQIKEKRPLVIVSAGGAPHDIDLIQAHKALECASNACMEGGTIVFLAECSDGAGSRDFEKYFGYGDKRRIAEDISEKYVVGGQTAWSFLEKTERFDIRFVVGSGLDSVVKPLFPTYDSLHPALEDIDQMNGFIMPFGSKFLPTIEKGTAD